MSTLAEWNEYRRHYSPRQLRNTEIRLKEAGLREGADWKSEETDGKTVVFYLRAGLDPESIWANRTSGAIRPWRITAVVDGKQVEDVYRARSAEEAMAWYRQDLEWRGEYDEVEILSHEELEELP